MIFYVILLWSVVVSPKGLNAERHDFKLDGFEVESQKWIKPHADVFSYSEEPTTDNLSELLGTARDTVHSDQLHAAIEACQNRISTLGQQVKNIDINVQRFVKHLIRIYDESNDSHKGLIFMKITSEDMKVLKSFANDGKFSSRTHSNIHDLLRITFTLPTQSMMEKLLPVMNIIIWIPTAMCQFAVYVFQEIRLLLMQIVFSADLVIYASMFLPVIVLSLSLWRGKSLKSSFCATAGMVMVIAYFVELRNAFEVARAKDMAKMTRAKFIPPECTGAELGYFDWALSGVRSLFSSEDRCEKYFRDQIPEPAIEVSEVFWKIIFAPLTVAMDKFGYGLRQFMTSFGQNLGWFTSVVLVPVGIVALLLFLALLGAFVTGGSVALPFFGRISFRNPGGQRGEAPADGASAQAQGNTPPQPAITNVYNYNLFNSSHPTLSQITAPPNFNLSITAPNGPTLQLTSSQSPDNNIPSSSPYPSGQSLTIAAAPDQSGQSLTIAAAPDQSGQSLAIAAAPDQSGQSLAIAARPDRKKLTQRTISSPAGSLDQQQLTSATFAETNRGAQRPALVEAFSETDYRHSFDTSVAITNYFALRENGGGDFVARDPTLGILPSGMLRYRHHRKLSL